MPNRTQGLVLGFFALAWLSLAAILVLAPDVYDQVLNLPPRAPGAHVGFLLALAAFLVLLGTGVVRRWRWAFWLILIAFLAGALRVPASLLQLTGVLPRVGPTWYELFQTLLGVVQFLIGLAMLAGYRRAGVWASF